MSTQPTLPATRSLPDRPDLRHLKKQAADLFAAGVASSVTDAQFRLAREYGFASWPKLKAHVESGGGAVLSVLEQAIRSQDLPALQALIDQNQNLLNERGEWAHRRRHNDYRPLEYAAYFGKTDVVRLLLDAGALVEPRTLQVASYNDDSVDVMRLLLARGGDANLTAAVGSNVPYPLIFGPADTLSPTMLRCLLHHGARPDTQQGGVLARLLANNNRNATAKAECLAALADAGVEWPDTPVMAVHCRRLDLLAAHVAADPDVVRRSFTEAEIHLGVSLPALSAYVTPLQGVTLLHMAVEWNDVELATWLLDNGADVDAAADTDTDGFGGWTPLYHAMVTLASPRRQPGLVRQLLGRGARTDVRGSIRKPIERGDDGQIETFELRDVTPLDYARQFVYPELVNEAAVEALART